MKRHLNNTDRSGAAIRFGQVALLACFLFAAVFISSASAWEYVSFSGKFKISLPEGWQRVDFRAVDLALQQSRADRAALTYEAVFSPEEGLRFTDVAYVILTLDTIGDVSTIGKDSLLKYAAGALGERPQDIREADLMTNLESTAPVFDPVRKTVSIFTDVSEPGEAGKKNLLVLKFYNRGIASFYCYAPDSLFAESKPVFAAIVNSFTTENLETTVAGKDVKVADLKSRTKKRISPVVWGVAAIMAIVIIAVLVRKRKRT